MEPIIHLFFFLKEMNIIAVTFDDHVYKRFRQINSIIYETKSNTMVSPDIRDKLINWNSFIKCSNFFS